jgi:Sep15/SelM redox domain
LNRLPELKSFLKDGEAEQYEGVTVKYIHGRTAVMTIYDANQEEVKKVDLHTIRSKETLHAIMRENGFVLKKELAATAAPPMDVPITTNVEADRILEVVTILEKTSPIPPNPFTLPRYPYIALPIGTVVVLIVAASGYFGAFGRRRNLRVQ